jgi:hypothetical protein
MLAASRMPSENALTRTSVTMPPSDATTQVGDRAACRRRRIARPPRASRPCSARPSAKTAAPSTLVLGASQGVERRRNGHEHGRQAVPPDTAPLGGTVHRHSPAAQPNGTHQSGQMALCGTPPGRFHRSRGSRSTRHPEQKGG